MRVLTQILLTKLQILLSNGSGEKKPIPDSQSNFSSQSLQDIAAVMPTPGYAYAKKIAKLTKEIKIKAS